LAAVVLRWIIKRLLFNRPGLFFGKESFSAALTMLTPQRHYRERHALRHN